LHQGELLSEQMAYYRARAREYDAWWHREGRYDRGAEANAQWFAEAREVEQSLESFAPVGEVLELACGTGLWTRQLVRHAGRVTAVDASEEMLAINRARVGSEAADYVQADLFEWAPARAAYDVCFFGFWLSHVPDSRFAGFWEMVRQGLRGGGRAFFIDSGRSERSTARDHRLPGESAETMVRRLDDGREFRIVKRFYEPRALERRLAGLGWRAEVRSTGEFFIYGWAGPAA
jgi:demethylmenaquinone methyltransferase/2-methoxy-6-polyprenyl-1,4-benzoquinol methylase